MTDETAVGEIPAPEPGVLPPGLIPSGPSRAALVAMTTAISKLDVVLTHILTEQLPPRLAQAMSDTRLMCGPCALARSQFNAVHGDSVRFAWLQACAAKGVDPASEAAFELQRDLVAFLPDELKPDPEDPVAEGRWVTGFPEVCRIGGTGYCAFHVERLAVAQPDAPPAGEQPQPEVPKKPILYSATSDLHAAAAAARQGMPGS